MKRFRFPLRPVGVLRAHQEARARAAFASAVQVYVKAEELLASTKARVAELGKVLAAGRSGQFSPAESAAFFQHYRQESAAVIVAEKQVFTAAEAMRAARATYLEATRAVKIIEKLEEKARLAHRLETERVLQNELDEFASLRRLRSSLVV